MKNFICKIKPVIENHFAPISENGKCQILPLKGGANNRVYKICTPTQSFVLKHYFTHPGDPSDRLQVEFRFCKFAWQNGVRTLPQPLNMDPKNRFAIYEYLKGSTLEGKTISKNHVEQVLTFFYEINLHKNQKIAQMLPAEKEACFSIKEHLDCIEKRIQGLNRIDKSSSLGLSAWQLVREGIKPLWEKIKKSILTGCSRFHIELTKKILPQDRVLSHSDIGFHNAIQTAGGQLRFIDFEYAGWGDPAKMVCDFFCAPKVPVPIKYFEEFRQGVAGHLKEPDNFLKRVELLFPLYQLKWCCILMNDFLPLSSSRRRFSLGKTSQKELRMQLKKVQEAVQKIHDGLH